MTWMSNTSSKHMALETYHSKSRPSLKTKGPEKCVAFTYARNPDY